MRTEEHRPIRLQDYRPPDWLIETVDLDVSLHPTATTVRAKLKLKPNSAGTPAPLVLDGEELKLESLTLDGKPLPAENFVATPDRLTIAQPPNRPFELEIETVVDPTNNTQLMGLYRAGADLLHAVRGRRLSPHHLFPRPAGRDGGLHHAHRGRQKRSAGAARQRQSRPRRATCRAPRGISRCGTIRSRSRPICSRWSAASWRRCRDSFTTMSGRKVALHIYVEPGKEDRCAYAMDSLKRAMRWDEEAFGREYDLDIFMIVAVSAFNMGAMENKGLNVFNDKYVLASPAERDRQRLCQHRGGDRARIFPQLDRRPHHLPRLVSALPEGRA